MNDFISTLMALRLNASMQEKRDYHLRELERLAKAPPPPPRHDRLFTEKGITPIGVYAVALILFLVLCAVH